MMFEFFIMGMAFFGIAHSIYTIVSVTTRRRKYNTWYYSFAPRLSPNGNKLWMERVHKSHAKECDMAKLKKDLEEFHPDIIDLSKCNCEPRYYSAKEYTFAALKGDVE